MVNLSDSARKLLQEQRKRYVESLPQKKADLLQFWDLAAEGHATELLDAVHRLAGSSGLHGLDVIQSLAAEVEDAIKEHLSREEYVARFDALLAAIDLESPQSPA